MSKYDKAGKKWFQKKHRKRDRLLVTDKRPWIGDNLPQYRSAKANHIIGRIDRVRVVGRKV